MKFQIIPLKEKEYIYYISPLSGSLIRTTESKVFNNILFCEKIQLALDKIENPFQIHSINPLLSEEACNRYNISVIKKTNQFHNTLLKLGNKRFFLSRIYASLSNPLFENTISAFDAISKISIQKDHRHELCFQRALLAAKTSKTFKNNGILFIGASFPSGKMHAWIMEGDVQPDRLDREWIMYRPLLAMYY